MQNIGTKNGEIKIRTKIKKIQNIGIKNAFTPI